MIKLDYTKYKVDTGEILQALTVPDDFIPPVDEGEAMYSGYFTDDKYYFSNGNPVERPEMEISISNNIIQNIPEDSILTIGDVDYVISDGTLEYENLPGTYSFEVKNFPYKTFYGELIINEN